VEDVSRWTSTLLVVAVLFLPIGWVLVFVSGYGGNSTGGSEIAWRIGGLVVYAAFAMLLLAAVIHVARLVAAAARRRRPVRP
jgi:multisubunit Na+/H+ antiporter MnhE subunit